MKRSSMLGVLATVFFSALPDATAADGATVTAGPDMLTSEPLRAFTARRLQAGVRLAYGLDTADELGGDANPYAAGVGLAVGYTLRMQLYLGASFEYYLGNIENILNDEPRFNVYSAMFEPGFDIPVLRPVVLRPQLGAGLSVVNVEGCLAIEGPDRNLEVCPDETQYKFAVAPGALLLFDDIGGMYGQIGVRYHHIFDADDAAGVLLHAGIAAAF